MYAMPIAKTDQLFHLIHSLDKAEKRNFKLYVGRLDSNKNPLFLQLFDAIDKMKEPDDTTIIKKIEKIDQKTLSNVKRHLYGQILKSLRLIHSKKDPSIQIREQIDYSQILYGKGLYLQSLKILDRARNLAKNANSDLLLFEILEREKLIESRHITRSRKIKNKVENLIEDSTRTKEIVNNAADLTNLNLKIHGLYIKKGHVRNELDVFLVKDYFFSNINWVSRNTTGFFEKVSLHQAYVWYYYTCLDFPLCYKHAKAWIDLFEEKPFMKEKDPDLYMRGQHYLLTILFYMDHKDAFRKYYRLFMEFHNENNDKWNPTSNMIYFIYGYNAIINNHFIKGEFIEVIKMKTSIENNIKQFKGTLDQHRQITFYYKLAWSYIALGRPEEAIDYINMIMTAEQNKLRIEILCYTRILLLIAHYMVGNFMLVLNMIPTVSRYFKQQGENNPIEHITLNLIKKMSIAQSSDIDEVDKSLKQLLQYFNHPFYKRVFIYFNFIHWIKSLKSGTTMEEIITNEYSSYLDEKLYKQ
jgi:tetratricopeptide (TPR) repeat protein